MERIIVSNPWCHWCKLSELAVMMMMVMTKVMCSFTVPKAVLCTFEAPGTVSFTQHLFMSIQYIPGAVLGAGGTVAN